MSIFNYQSDGTEPEGLSPTVQMAFMFIKDQLDRDGEKYRKLCERNRGNAQKRYTKSATAAFGSSSQPTACLNDNDNDNDNDTDTDTDTDTDNDTDTEGSATKSGMNPDSCGAGSPAAKRKKKSKKTVGSFDTDEFFEAALKRSYNLSPQDTG